MWQSVHDNQISSVGVWILKLSPASTEFYENVEIPWKQENSMAWLKITHFTENYDPSLVMSPYIFAPPNSMLQ